MQKEMRISEINCWSNLVKTNNKCKLPDGNTYYDIEYNSQMDLINNQMKRLEDSEIIYLDIYKELKTLINKDLENIYSYYSDKDHLTRKAALKLTNYFKSNIFN